MKKIYESYIRYLVEGESPIVELSYLRKAYVLISQQKIELLKDVLPDIDTAELYRRSLAKFGEEFKKDNEEFRGKINNPEISILLALLKQLNKISTSAKITKLIDDISKTPTKLISTNEFIKISVLGTVDVIQLALKDLVGNINEMIIESPIFITISIILCILAKLIGSIDFLETPDYYSKRRDQNKDKRGLVESKKTKK